MAGEDEQGSENRDQREGSGRRDVASRMVAFSVRILRLVEAMPRSQIGRHVGMQLARSATASGANYAEARGAESRKDFIHKLGIVVKELRETCFWLEVIHESGLVQRSLGDVRREADELTAIFVKSRQTARANTPDP
jgi:four helix bundle protein